MLVCDYPQGRYGNAIFRYLASSLFCILYNGTRTYNQDECNSNISDTDFNIWFEKVLSGELPVINTSKNYVFYGYFQHDAIFLKYKKLLIDHIKQNPGDLLITDGYKPGGSGIYHYAITSYNSIGLLVANTYIPKHDVVVHLRLEDFVFVNQALHPKCIADVLETMKDQEICFVVNKPTTSFEHKYIEFFKNRFHIVCESNDPVTDYHIMKNAKTLVCSRSTMCWAASFFSDSLETVYFPNYIHPNHPHETFKRPIENTIPYDVVFASEHDISVYLNSL